MRLGQLARKISVTPSKIIEFLTAQGISLENGSNARLTQEQVELVVSQLAPWMKEFMESAPVEAEEPTIDEPETKEEIAPPAEATLFVPTEAVESSIEPRMADTSSAEESNDQEQSVAGVEVIKAPKVELPGLKVLGKIELPQPKKKEELVSEPSGDAETQGPSQEKPGRYRNKAKVILKHKGDRNSIAEQREREAREEAKRLQKAQLQKKQARTENYQKRVKSKPAKSLVKKEKEVLSVAQPSVGNAPRTFFGKLKHWLFNS